MQRPTFEGVVVDHLFVEGEDGLALEADGLGVAGEGGAEDLIAAARALAVVEVRQQEARVHLDARLPQRRRHRQLHVTVVEARRLSTRRVRGVIKHAHIHDVIVSLCWCRNNCVTDVHTCRCTVVVSY